MKIILVFALFAISIFANAQSYHAKNICNGTLMDYNSSESCAIDNKGNSTISGVYSSSFSINNSSISTNYNKAIYLSKIDSNNQIVWLKNIVEVISFNSTHLLSCGFITDKNRNIIFCHSFDDSIITFNTKVVSKGQNDILLEKIDSNGNLIWKTVIYGQFDDRVFRKSLATDENDNIYLTGYYGSKTNPQVLDSVYFNGTILSNIGGDFFIAKYDKNGNLIWTKGNNIAYEGGGGNIINYQKQSVFIVGSTSSNPSGLFLNQPTYIPSSATEVVFISRMDTNGICKWVRIIYSTGWSDRIKMGGGSAILKNGKIVVYGFYNSMSSIIIQGFSTFPANSTSASNNYIPFAICYDSIGTVVWAKTLNGGVNAYQNNTASGIVSSKANNDFFLISYFDGSITISGNDTVYGSGYQNVLIECMDSMGNKKWHKLIKGFPGANARDIAINDNNEIIIVGNTSSNTLQCDAKKVNISSTPAMYILKLAPGDVNWNDTLNGFEKVIESKEQLVVYPNPVSNMLICKCANMLMNAIEITDVLGRVCTIPPFLPNVREGLGGFELNISNLPSGIYFIKTTDTNGNRLNGKFVKQ